MTEQIFEIGFKIEKPLTEDSRKLYTKLANWCNSQEEETRIEDRGDYYEAVKVEKVQPTAEELALTKAKKKYYTLLKNLQNTDYIAMKIAEGVSSKEDYSEVLENRQLWRNEINAILEEYPQFKS